MAEEWRALGEVSSFPSVSDKDPLRAVASRKIGLGTLSTVSGVVGAVLELWGLSAVDIGVDTSGECSCAVLEVVALAELVEGMSAGICTSRRLALNRCGKSNGRFLTAIGRFCFALILGRRSGLPQSPQALDQFYLFSCSMIWRARGFPFWSQGITQEFHDVVASFCWHVTAHSYFSFWVSHWRDLWGYDQPFQAALTFLQGAGHPYA